MSKPKCSVVIPAYKAANTIEKAIRSCFLDDNITVEVIVVEDGVFDDTAAVIEQLEVPVTFVQLTANSGAQVARNTGLEKVTSDTVMFLDSDDYLEPPLLSALHQAIIEQESDIALGPMKTVDENNRLLSHFIPKSVESRAEIADRWLRGFSFPHPCAVMWRTSAIKAIGKWDEQITRNQDGELILRALRQHLKVALVQKGAGVYLDHSGERVSKVINPKSYESQEIVLARLTEWHQAEPEVMRASAIAEYCALEAAKAYNDGLINIGQAWENKISDFGKLRISSYQGRRNRTLRLLAYKAFGIRRAEKLRRLLGI